MSKICSTCKKPKTEYSKCSGNKDGLQYNCKECSSVYSSKLHKENPEKKRATSRKWQKENPERYKATMRKWYNEKSIHAWIKTKYENIPCIDCNGVFIFIAMDFDHRPEETKLFVISTFDSKAQTATNIAKVEKEIAKCDLVCSNCHRVRTWDRKHND